MSILSFNNVSLGYEGNRIIDNLTFNVNKGDYLTIIGENGAGKSTIMKAISGIISPIAGSITLEKDFSKKDIGYLPQQTQIQNDFPATVKEIVYSGCLSHCGLHPFFKKTERELVSSAMKKLNIQDLAGRYYKELSGGQKQRTLLARAICSAQKLLLLDEPVTGLDPKVTQEFYEIVYMLNKKEDITVIMISHDVDTSLKYASKVLYISGKSIFFGTKEEYCSIYLKGGNL